MAADDLEAGMRAQAAAAGLGCTGTAVLLIGRTVSLNAQVSALEADPGADLRELRAVRRDLLTAVREFGTLTHRAASAMSADERYKSQFRACLEAALRRLGPDAPARELVPVLAAELQAAGLLRRQAMGGALRERRAASASRAATPRNEAG